MITINVKHQYEHKAYQRYTRPTMGSGGRTFQRASKHGAAYWHTGYQGVIMAIRNRHPIYTQLLLLLLRIAINIFPPRYPAKTDIILRNSSCNRCIGCTFPRCDEKIVARGKQGKSVGADGIFRPGYNLNCIHVTRGCRRGTGKYLYLSCLIVGMSM